MKVDHQKRLDSVDSDNNFHDFISYYMVQFCPRKATAVPMLAAEGTYLNHA
jgi:hypothetical protein